MSNFHEIKEVTYQLSLLQKELDDVAPLLSLLSQREPDGIELRAASAVLQTFYNGIESVLFFIMNNNSRTEKHNDWHQKLLEKALNDGLITEDLYMKLDIFRKFRHKFRHSYGFSLRWDMMAPLINKLLPTFSDFKTHLGL